VIQRTYGQAKAEIARVCGVSGMPVTDGRILQRTNDGIQELMNEGAWPGVVDRWHIVATSGSIVLPPQLDMLLEFTADGVPLQIMSRWAEFVAYGSGPASDLISRGSNSRRWWRCDGQNVYDRGESPVRVDIPPDSAVDCVCDGSSAFPTGPWVLRQYANPSAGEAVDAYSTIQGLDENGLLIRSQINNGSGVEWINGVQVGITSGSSFVETTQQFSKITAYTKPETNGYVRLTAWNGTTEVELSNYEPWETEPSYRRYFSPFLEARRDSTNPCCRVVLARARRRFVPVKEDTDVLMISNILALKEIVIAQWKRESGNGDDYILHKTTAVDILKKEAVAYNGKVRTPAMTFQRGFSLGELPAIR
jgi:hypothetical protein